MGITRKDFVFFRATAGLRQAVRAYAESEQLNLSQAASELIRFALRAKGYWPPKEESSDAEK